MEAGLLAGAQAVEHYEIARYGTLVEWARLLGYKDAAKLLEQTLEEEKATDKLLTQMAEGGINQSAADAQDSDEEETPSRSKSSRKRAA
jgi:ferritin-like metal-binding protein YciE